MNVLIDNLNIDVCSMDDVDMVTPQLVYQAINKLQPNKSDNSFNWKSNAFLTTSDILTNHFTLLFQSFLIHGYIPNCLLSCNLKPIVKDNMGDKFTSNNYRAIGISSLVIKVLDWVILILFGNELKPSELQFGFQLKNSTTMCSWVVSETVNYFNNRNTPVFTCFLDLTKAFDLVNFTKLFENLKSRITPVFLRLLAYIYTHQVCCVMWNNTKSNTFNVTNGVRQGAVLSPALFSLYINDLFSKLTKSGFGCHVNNVFYGLVGYADDLVLLSPDRTGLQNMLDISCEYLSNLGLSVSVNYNLPEKSKTKCVAFGIKAEFPNIILNGVPLPWSDSYNHLGHLFYKDGTLKHDFEAKRQSFVGQFHALRQELGHQNPHVIIKLINVYFSSFYGSNLWNIFNCDKLYTTWNNVIRNVFNLPYQTHRYLIEPVSGTSHLFTCLNNRFIKFYNTLCDSDKPIIRNLKCIQENDMRSTFGSNIRNICLSTACDKLDYRARNVKYHSIPDLDNWRVSLINDLLNYKNNQLQFIYNSQELSTMMDFATCS